MSANAKFDTLLASIVYLAEKKGQRFSVAALCAGLPLVEGCLTPNLVPRAVERVGMKALVVEKSLEQLSEILLPCILLVDGDKAVVLETIDTDKKSVQVYEPESKSLTNHELDTFIQIYSGFALLLSVDPAFDSNLNAESSPPKYAWFWDVLKHSKRIYRDVLVASLLINLFVIANPLFVMNVYDRVVPNSAIETLWALALGILVLYVFDFALRLLRTQFIEIAGKKTDIVLSSKIMEVVLGARYDSHPKSVGAFVSQLKDFDAVRNFVTSSTITAFIDFPFILIFLAVIAYIGGVLVWVPVFLIPIVLLYALNVHRKLKSLVERNMQASAQKNSTLVESLSNLETLKSLGAEGKVLSKWDHAVGQSSLWGMKSRVLSSSANTFSAYIQQISTVLIIIVGVYAIAEKELTQGALIACVILSSRALAPLAQMSGLLVQYYQSKIAIESIDEIFQKKQERPKGVDFIRNPSFKGAIEFRAVNFSYPDESYPSLKDININIRAGEKIAIIGRIGSGKSTLQKLLLGLYQPSSGNVLLDGVDISQFDPADIRNNIGYAPQKPELFFGTVRDNILYGSHLISDEELLKAATTAGVSEWINTHPQAYQRPVGERGANLSGGQAQSLVLARALVGNKTLVILDEPTTAMDNSSEANVIRKLKPALEGKTLLMVTHKVAMLALVDRLIVMDQGRVIADGEKSAVLEALKKGQLNAG